MVHPNVAEKETKTVGEELSIETSTERDFQALYRFDSHYFLVFYPLPEEIIHQVIGKSLTRVQLVIPKRGKAYKVGEKWTSKLYFSLARAGRQRSVQVQYDE